MRPASNILMATLIVAALLFGNCLSCPQMMMAVASHQPGHGCCHRPSPAKFDCHSQALSHFVKAQGASLTPMFASLGVAPALARPAVAPWLAADVPPPDLLSLHSLLRV